MRADRVKRLGRRQTDDVVAFALKLAQAVGRSDRDTAARQGKDNGRAFLVVGKSGGKPAAGIASVAEERLEERHSHLLAGEMIPEPADRVPLHLLECAGFLEQMAGTFDDDQLLR